MQITIIVSDKLVIVGGVAVHLPNLDWSSFDGDPSTPWDDIQAVQYSSDDRQGHVEYRTITTQPATRPNIRPGDRMITAAEFNSEFAWVLEAYAAEKSRLEAEAARRAQEAPVAIEGQAAHAPDHSEALAAIQAKLAALEAQNAELKAFKDSVANIQLPEAET